MNQYHHGFFAVSSDNVNFEAISALTTGAMTRGLSSAGTSSWGISWTVSNGTGVRTIVDPKEPSEVDPDVVPAPGAVTLAALGG